MDDSEVTLPQVSRRFLAIWASVGLLAATVVVGFNVTIDSYLVFDMPRVAGLNARKPAIDTHQYLMKAVDVSRQAPTTLLFGSSRVGFGMDSGYRGWPPEYRPVYNMAFTGLNRGPYLAYRYLQHTLPTHHPRTVILGLEFEQFLKSRIPEWNGFERRLSTSRTGETNPGQGMERVRDQLQSAFSSTAVLDSFETWAANRRPVSVDVKAGSWELPNGVWKAELTPVERLVTTDLITMDAFVYTQRELGPMDDLRAFLDLCQSQGIRAILFINPEHADNLEIISTIGYWELFESWKRALIDLVEPYQQAEGEKRVALWDFTGYNAYSTQSPWEASPPWFGESRHYTRRLGNLVIRDLVEDRSQGLGVRLNRRNIDAHLATIRTQQGVYRQEHPDGVWRVRYLHGKFTAMQQKH